MRKVTYCILSIVFFNVSLTFGQSAWKKYFYDSIPWSSFRDYDVFNQPVDITQFDHQLANAAVFYVTNEERAKRNLPVLKYVHELEIAAWNHSRDMVKEDFFSHINSKNRKRKSPDDRARLSGIANPFIAENIAEGFILQYKANKPVRSVSKGKFSYSANGPLIPPHSYLSLADELVKSWMNSPGHRRNLLSKDAMELGCGVYPYKDTEFNDMPTVKATQNFQLYAPAQINAAPKLTFPK